VLDIVSEGESLIMVMEFVDGDTVGRLLQSARAAGTPLPCRVVTGIMVGALRGLHAAHEAVGDDGQPLNIVHRDVSLQNIIVGLDGVPRVLDFGVAKAAVRLQTTRAGQLKGRLQYMAPEQIRNQPIDRRVDVYSASVVLWEALAGRPLFEADNEGAMMIKVLEGTIPSLRDANPDVPPSLEWVILQGLRPNCADRYQTAQEMAVAIEQAAGTATAQEVSAWVRAVVPPETAQRAARIAGLDLDSFGPVPLADQLDKAPVERTSPVQRVEPPKRKGLWVTAVGLTGLMLVIGFWIALHRVSWLGPWLISTSRSVLGDEATAWIERVAHAADHGWRSLWGQEQRPEAYWNLPSASASGSAGQPPPMQFQPEDLQPMNSAPFSRGDGAWIPTHDPEGNASPRAYRLVLHPDVDRREALVRLVAFDRRRCSFVLAPGNNLRLPDAAFPSTGLVEPSHANDLMAVIQYSDDGMASPAIGLRGQGALVPKPGACTLAQRPTGRLSIDAWNRIQGEGAAPQWYREVPRCLVAAGVDASSLDDSPVPRIMAIGIGPNAQPVYVALGHAVSTSTMARVLRYASARFAAQIGGDGQGANLYFHSPHDADPKELAPEPGDGQGAPTLGVTSESPSDFLYVVRQKG